ncbi:hypothetical protein AMAG_10858 [Allomyces macrogynus ATCC 38327]|uniref:alanine--glyoxylate transaminase n=1 Tax=Allomyces macrogynus (strain ATCC 38327) TaxID=578462 RepID=A0A0L0SS74_ALLM3|nr:hypothetical protein AMAG_10858 [Allomyces macrogynus ATCC 38327]|eukprot:KNE65210.1 hypothetical protein AMAG_10858 [Allomyces macrogynus ATCC 38327]
MLLAAAGARRLPLLFAPSRAALAPLSAAAIAAPHAATRTPTTRTAPTTMSLSSSAPVHQESAHKLCMIPGPIEFHDDVLAQMATPATSHVDPSFIGEFGASLEMLRKIFKSAKGQPFIVAGSGTLGWDMVAANLVEPGENALVVNTGLFGDRFGECLQVYGAKVTHLHAPAIGAIPAHDEVVKAVKAQKYKVVTITHVDTSTGVLQDVKTLAKLIRDASPSTLVIVDGVCSVGGEDLDMDAWGVDVVLTASQKALGCPPGLCVVVASERAMQSFQTRVAPPTAYYASWAKWTPIMQAYEARKPSYFATPAVQTIKALHTSLQQLVAKPLAERYAQHVRISDHVKQTVLGWGLKLVPTDYAHAAHTLTAVYYPEGVAGPALLGALSGKGVVVAGGLHPKIAPTYFRIGHMGLSATHEAELKHIEQTLKHLESALREQGFAPKNATKAK